MTRKHFEALALHLNSVQPQMRELKQYAQWQKDCATVAYVCSTFNSSFNKEKFLEACDYGGSKQINGK